MAATQERDYYSEARLLIRNAKTATLATVEGGTPHAAFVTVATLADYSPVLLLSQLATHTRQLQVNPACALLIASELARPNPQTTSRICLSGTAVTTDDPVARAKFLECHPYAAGYADFGDFAFWNIVITQAYYIGGFAAARHLAISQLIGPQ